MMDAPPLRGADLPHTDPSALDRLHRFGGDKLLREMIALFLAAAPERIAAARAANERGDAAGVELALHSLKSSSAQLGAMRMQRLSEHGERRAREGSLHGIAAVLRELEQAYVTVGDWLAGIADGARS